MPDDRITDGKTLLAEVSAFGHKLKERRQFERKRLLWAATVEVRGQRFEGMIVDLSPGGARIRFDAAVAEGDELTLMLKQLDELGAKVVWQREGEAGIQFLLAPDEVVARVQSMLPLDIPGAESRGGERAPEVPADPAVKAGPAVAAEPKAPAASEARRRGAPPPRPTAPPSGARRVTFTALIATGVAMAVGASVVVATAPKAGNRSPLAITLGAVGQHSCDNLMGRIAGATNQVDFSLNVASAVNAKCLDMQHLGPSSNNLNAGMVQAAKRPLH